MKNAKKSMFITTILMVAVLVVAVSTATFAWYTATTSVTATNAEVFSASSTSADIAIGWTSSAQGESATSLVIANSTPILPMVPTAEIAKDATSIAFNSAPMNTSNQFTAPISNPSAWEINNTTESNKQFYVINHNINKGVKVKMTATFAAGADANLSDDLCVAVLVNGKVAGVFAKGAYKYGTIVAGTGNNSLTDATYFVAPDAGITFDLGAKADGSVNSAYISVYAWIDGEALTSPDAGKSVATFSFNFAEDTSI